MKNLIISLLLLFVLQVSYSQQQPYQEKPVMFQTKIFSANGHQTEGVLLALGDSSVQLISVEMARRGLQGYKMVPIEIPVNQILTMKTRRVGAATFGALMGGLAGLVAGIAYGLADYEPCDFSYLPIYDCSYFSTMSQAGWATLHGAAGLGIGMLTGMLIGFSRKSYKLDGNIEKYRQQKHKLEKHVFKI